MNNFTFNYPPPPPLPLYTTILPPPPPPPVTTSCIVQPAPPPPLTTNASWENFDFSRPPPPVINGLRISTANGITVANGYRIASNSISSPSLSPGTSQENSSYRVNNDISQLYVISNRQYPLRRHKTDHHSSHQSRRPKNNFRKSRNDGQIEQRNDYSERSNYGSCDTKPTSNRFTRSFETSPNSDTKYQERSGHRGRKRKKPLSQSVPSKKGWTDEEANMALEIEKEYNKLFKNHSLRIRFPDQELNREIVSKYHPSIEAVYFQQPSNARFCYVTLAEGADPNAVIEELSKIKFGEGFLSAEYKREREEEQNVSAEEIDPLCLYVGNLVPEVTKEDMVNLFPKNKRIDIGFAKKMRHTRYAFVVFKNVTDAVEAFKATHCADLHSKSMIVRFRRLHGTVGLPGEPKPQYPSRNSLDESRKISSYSSVKSDQVSIINLEQLGNADTDETRYVSPAPSSLRNDFDGRTISECSDSSAFDLNLVKNEPFEYPNDDSDSYHLENDVEHYQDRQNHSTTPPTDARVPDASSSLAENTNPENSQTAAVVKTEPAFINPFLAELSSMFPVIPIPLKKEPSDDEDSSCGPSMEITEDTSDLVNGFREPKKENEISEPNPEDNEEEFNTTTDFGSVLDNLKRRPNFMT